MPDVKNQHYVPQFYLKYFTGKNELVYAFNKFNGESFLTKARNIASETRFYDMHSDIHNEFRERITNSTLATDDAELIAKALNPQWVEHELAEREAAFAPLFKDVVETIQQKNYITEEQRYNFVDFLVMQFLRTPEYRRDMIEMQMSISTKVLDMVMRMRNSATDKIHLKFDERYASLEHAQMMFDPELHRALCQVLINHIWMIGINTTNSHFYTSDTPLVKRSHNNEPNRGVGLGSVGVEIVFPLTPKYVLILRERTAFSQLEPYDLRTLSLTPENVMYYNSLQVFQSYRYVYCPFGEFLMAVEICAEHPEICTPDRKKWKIS